MRYIPIVVVILSLTGCARSVIAPYSVNLVDDRIYVINVPGTYEEVMRNYSVYRAAEQAEKLGCSYFFAINNNAQSLAVRGNNKMDNSFQQDNGVSYYIDGASRYKIVRPSGRSNMYACTTEKPNGIIPGLYYKSAVVVQNDIPKYEKPGFHLR